MKRLLLGIIMLSMVMGCTALQIQTTSNVATDGAFYLILKNNPDYKAPVIAALQRVRVFLSQDITYDALVLEVTKSFGEKYAYIGVILSEYLAMDKPIFETYQTLYAPYKAAVVKKLDRLILLANI